MTNIKFCIDQQRYDNLYVVYLKHSGTIMLRQEDKTIFLEPKKLDETIKTLKMAKKWLNS